MLVKKKFLSELNNSKTAKRKNAWRSIFVAKLYCTVFEYNDYQENVASYLQQNKLVYLPRGEWVNEKMGQNVTSIEKNLLRHERSTPDILLRVKSVLSHFQASSYRCFLCESIGRPFQILSALPLLAPLE